MTRFAVPRGLAVLSLLLAGRSAIAADAPSSPGAALYQQNCATCHDHPKDRIPAKEMLARRTPEEVVTALTTGSMRVQAGGLNRNDQVALATYLTGRVPSENPGMPAEKNLCPGSARFEPVTSLEGNWNGWGVDFDNSRFQPKPGLAVEDLPKLKLKWAFGYHGSSIYGQPTVVGGRVYVTSVTGRVYSLDAATGCTYWTYDAAGPSRTAISFSDAFASPSSRTGIPTVFFGDDSATVYALNAVTGKLRWKQRLDAHLSARISGAPTVYSQTLYVPVSSLEELAAAAPGYQCCTFRGSVAAVRTSDGRVLWQTYTIDKKAAPSRKAKDGTQLYGPAGVAVWSAPTLDPSRHALYVGTGNSYTDETAPHANSILALSMDTGQLLWANQIRGGDNYIVGCEAAPAGPCELGKACPKGPPNCPTPVGPDVDFGTSPILRTLPGGKQVLMTGQKSGEVHALDPQTGKEVWSARVGAGSSLGGIEWGPAADKTQLYAAVSDVVVTTGNGPGGLTALRIADGKRVWRAPPPKPVCSWGTRGCTAAQSQAVSVIPGAVFSGSHDGHLRAFSTVDGKLLWDTDTGVTFQTVNGVAAAGGSLDHGGATIAGGRVFVNSGYGRINGQPGNVLLVYGLP